MSAVISQKEYIKRYLSKSDSKKKRKKKKPDVSSRSQLRIVDDDIDVSNMRPVDDEELELYNLDEDAPQVAGVIDERPEELRVLEDFRTSKRWKIVSDSTSDIKVTELHASSESKDFGNNAELEKDTGKKLISGRRGSAHAESDESSLPHSIRDSKQPREDSDASPPRKPRVQNVSKPSSQNASTFKIKSDRIIDSDSDLSVSRRSDSKYQNYLEHTFNTHKGERTLPHTCKGSENRRTKNQLSNGSDSDLVLPRQSRKTERVKHSVDKQKEHRKKKLDEGSDSDFSLPRPSKSRDRVGYKNRDEAKKIHRKKWPSGQSDSDLSMPHPSKSEDKMKYIRPEEMRKRQWKKGSSEQSDSDLSLPRSSKREDKMKHKRPEEMRKRQRKMGSSEQSDSDLSLPRPSKREDKVEHKRPHEVSKRQRKKRSSEQSDSDLSLPRPSKRKDIVKQRSEEDTKKYRKKEMSEESDSSLSPSQAPKSKGSVKHNKSEVVRKRVKRKGSSEESASDLPVPPSRNKDSMNRQRQSNQKDGDRISRKAESDYPKMKSRNSDTYGPQNTKRNDRFDHSTVRQTHHDARAHPLDEQGARKHISSHGVSSRRDERHGSDSPSRRSPHSNHKFDKDNLAQSRNSEVGSKKLQKTLDGKLAGLQDAKQLREEIISFAARENETFSKMSDDVSGRLAKAVQRDRKTGKKRDLEEEARIQSEKDEKEQKFKEKYSRWGKGLKQVEDQKQNLEEAMKLMSKPLARYADDEDLDKHLRNQEREGDPMLEYIRSKKSSTDSQTTVKPKYQGSYPTNRFGIPPGYRWDGVDRSSGYEKQWFEQQSAKKAREEEAYKWSTADM